MANERADRAIEAMQSGFSCAEAVLQVFAPSFGLTEETAVRLASGLGAGIARTGATCGSLTAGAIVLGLAIGRSDAADRTAKEATYRAVRALFSRFRDVHGATDCTSLLGADLGIPEEYERMLRERLFDLRCPAFVRTAVESIETLVR